MQLLNYLRETIKTLEAKNGARPKRLAMGSAFARELAQELQPLSISDEFTRTHADELARLLELETIEVEGDSRNAVLS